MVPMTTPKAQRSANMGRIWKKNYIHVWGANHLGVLREAGEIEVGKSHLRIISEGIHAYLRADTGIARGLLGGMFH